MIKQTVVAAALLATGLAESALAERIVAIGTGVVSVTNISDNVVSTLVSDADTAFSQIPGAAIFVSVAGDPDLFTITFTGETRCNDTEGAATGWCAVRIVATRAGTPDIIFNPNAAVSGVNIRDAAFDANPTGLNNSEEWEFHSLTASARLPVGNWMLRAQRAVEVTSGSTTFLLDDWNMNIIRSE
jgi:hypothetical protein